MKQYKSYFLEAEEEQAPEQEFGQEEKALRNFNAIKEQIPFGVGSTVRVIFGDKGFQSEFVGKFKISGGMITIVGKKNDSQKFMANRMRNIKVDDINLTFEVRCSATFSFPVQIHEEIG
jgi:hypothetical protein